MKNEKLNEPGESAAPKRELCAVAKLGRKCSDDICRGSQITLCGFDQDDWDDEIGQEEEDFDVEF